MKACVAMDTFHTVHAEALRKTHQCFTRWQGACWVFLRDILEDANGKSSDNSHAATIRGAKHVANCNITHHLSRKQSHPHPIPLSTTVTRWRDHIRGSPACGRGHTATQRWSRD